MGVKVESQTIIICDYPNCNETYIDAYPRDYVVKMARKAGWAIGSYEARCPIHKGKRKPK